MSTAAKHFLFFYRFASAYLMSEVVFQDCSETICSPWHISLSSGGPSSSLTFIFTFFQVICSTSSKNPLMERETFGDWRYISSFTCKFSRWKRRRLIIRPRKSLSVCPSVCLCVDSFIYLSLAVDLFFLVSFWSCTNGEEITKKKNMFWHTSERASSLWSLCGPYSFRCQILRSLSEIHTQYIVTLKPGFKRSEHVQRCP